MSKNMVEIIGEKAGERGFTWVIESFL